MPPIQTIARPRRDRISIAVPKEYSSYSFQVILVPLEPERARPLLSDTRRRRHKTFVDALLSCPKLDEAGLDFSRDPADCGREIGL